MTISRGIRRFQKEFYLKRALPPECVDSLFVSTLFSRKPTNSLNRRFDWRGERRLRENVGWGERRFGENVVYPKDQTKVDNRNLQNKTQRIRLVEIEKLSGGSNLPRAQKAFLKMSLLFHSIHLVQQIDSF